MKKKKLLFVHWQSQVIGGAEIALVDLIRILESHYDVHNLFHSKGKVVDYYNSCNLSAEVRSMNTRRRLYPGLHIVQSLLMSIYLKKRKFDLIVCNTLPAVARIHTASSIAHINLLSFARDHFSYSKNNRELLRKPKEIIAVSKSIMEHISKFEGQIKTSVLYDYISSDSLAKRQNKQAENGTLNFVVVGRIQSIKQVEIVIAAFLKLINSNYSARLRIYGEPGPSNEDKRYYKSLLKLIEQYRVKGLISFEGFNSNVAEIFKSASALIVASKHEAFPRVILEAQLCNVPVIASYVGGIPEQIINLKTGYLFEVDNLTNEDKVSNLLAQKLI